MFNECERLRPPVTKPRALCDSRCVPTPRHQRQLPPLPVAIHVGEADLAQPGELRLHVEQFVRGVFLFGHDLEFFQELVMQMTRRRRNMLQVAEDAAGREQIEDLGVEAPLALVADVMNSEAGDDAIKAS